MVHLLQTVLCILPLMMLWEARKSLRVTWLLCIPLYMCFTVSLGSGCGLQRGLLLARCDIHRLCSSPIPGVNARHLWMQAGVFHLKPLVVRLSVVHTKSSVGRLPEDLDVPDNIIKCHSFPTFAARKEQIRARPCHACSQVEGEVPLQGDVHGFHRAVRHLRRCQRRSGTRPVLATAVAREAEKLICKTKLKNFEMDLLR